MDDARRQELAELIDRVKGRVIEEGDCWNWQGAMQGQGKVPMLNYKGHVLSVRRLIVRLQGINVEGFCVTQKCGNKSCVNPDHLERITRLELQRRIGASMTQASRQIKSERMAQFQRARIGKLTMEQVHEIRNSNEPQRALARKYGVAQGTIGTIMRGESWKTYANNPFAGLIR